MMDVSSMYGSHHHHSNSFHNGANEVSTVAAAAAAARNGYATTYFPSGSAAMPHVQHGQPAYVQHVQPFNYGSYNGNASNYYQQQQKQHTPPPQAAQTNMPQEQQQQQQPLYSHTHLFSPSAAEYGIVTSTTAAGASSGSTPHHAPSHSPTDSYYESDSMHSYYATAAVATIPPTINSPIIVANAAQPPTPTDPPIISSENGLSYTNLDCLYNQNQTTQQLMHQQYDYAPISGNCNSTEEKYANILNYGTAGVMVEESAVMHMSNQQQQSSNHVWHHHHHHHMTGAYALQDPSTTMDAINMHSHAHHNMSHVLLNAQTSTQQPTSASDELVTCLSARNQHVISPGGNTTQTCSGLSSNNQTQPQAKSPSDGSNLPTYKWMQLKRNVPKPQRK